MHPSKTSVVKYGIYSHINMQICLECALRESSRLVQKWKHNLWRRDVNQSRRSAERINMAGGRALKKYQGLRMGVGVKCCSAVCAPHHGGQHCAVCKTTAHKHALNFEKRAVLMLHELDTWSSVNRRVVGQPAGAFSLKGLTTLEVLCNLQAMFAFLICQRVCAERSSGGMKTRCLCSKCCRLRHVLTRCILCWSVARICSQIALRDAAVYRNTRREYDLQLDLHKVLA